jgi:hypothetical protein
MLYQLIVDVLAEHLNPLNLNLLWDLVSLFLVVKGTFVIFPSNTPLILWSMIPLPLL